MHGDDEAVVVKFVVVMVVVSPLRPLQMAADVLHKADVGPHGLQSARFVLWSGKPRVGGPSSCLCDINSARVRSENSNGTVMWTVREMVDERTIVAAQMACHRVSSDDGPVEEGSWLHRDAKNETMQKGRSVSRWNCAGQMRNGW